jgi:hypothetical protein
MTKKNEPEINWELTTWKGSRLAQHRAFKALPFSRKLEIVEEMCELARQLGKKQNAGQDTAALRETPVDHGSSDESDRAKSAGKKG